MEKENPVVLYLYDLSQGMARAMSRALTGTQIDGIWHTSVVVFGKEYYFGQGILWANPGTTLHGTPIQKIEMGSTMLSEEVFLEYVENLKEVYTAQSYHILDSNCNNFSNDVIHFLTNKRIPSFITGLPSDFLQTPFGQSLRPMIESFFGPSKHPMPSTTALQTPQQAVAQSSAFGTSTSLPSSVARLPLETLRSIGTNPIVFSRTSSGNVTKMFARVKESTVNAVDLDQSDLDSLKEMENSILVNCADTAAERFANEGKAEAPSRKVIHVWYAVLSKLWKNTSEKAGKEKSQSELFPLLDVLRLILTTPNVGQIFANSSSAMLEIRSILELLNESATTGEERTLFLTGLRLACNVLGIPDSRPYFFFTPAALARQSTATLRSPTTSLAVHGLLSHDRAVRKVAASAVWNFVLLWGITGNCPKSDQMEEVESGWVVEIFCAALECLGRDSGEDEEVAVRLLATLAYLLLQSPLSATAALDDLLEALSLPVIVDRCLGLVEEKRREQENTNMNTEAIRKKIEGLCADIQAVVKYRKFEK